MPYIRCRRQASGATVDRVYFPHTAWVRVSDVTPLIAVALKADDRHIFALLESKDELDTNDEVVTEDEPNEDDEPFHEELKVVEPNDIAAQTEKKKRGRPKGLPAVVAALDESGSETGEGEPSSDEDETTEA